MKNTLFAAAAALCLTVSGAVASTVSQTISFDSNSDSGLNFAAFDTGLGTFTSATLAFDGTLSLAAGSISGTTNSGSGAPVLQRNINGTLSFGPAPLSGSANASSLAVCFAGSGAPCSASYAGEGSNFGLVDSSTDVSLFDSAVFIPVSVQTSVTDPLDGLIPGLYGNVTSGPTSVWAASGTATLTYTFEGTDLAPVPVPASLPLVIGAMVLLGASARRRRS